uniref:G_PROTEIN_RECEP_F1_2 domain-containing protein n=1 Tax=Haemonchus contortus TaxID=6289 RepID=A0A7I4YH60_HAECO
MLAEESLPFIVYVITTFSLLANMILIIVYFCCPLKKVKSYKYFFLFAAMQDIIYSVSFLLSLPQVISQDYFLVFIATGVLRRRPIGLLLISLYYGSFFVSTLIVTNSFIYRYLHLCRTELFETLSTTRCRTLGFIINLLLMVIFFVILYVVALPSEELEYFVRNTVIISGVNINDSSFVGLAVKHSSSLDLILLANLALLVMAVAIINIFCARRIAVFLKTAALRHNTFQRRMFTLLLLQAGGPIFFAHVPLLFVVFLLLAGVDTTPLITSLIDILVSSLPLFNPIIIIVFITDYRNFVLFKLRFKKRTIGSKTNPVPLGTVIKMRRATIVK